MDDNNFEFIRIWACSLRQTAEVGSTYIYFELNCLSDIPYIVVSWVVLYYDLVWICGTRVSIPFANQSIVLLEVLFINITILSR